MTTPADVSRKAAAIAKTAADLARRMAAGLDRPSNDKLLLVAERLDAEAAELGFVESHREPADRGDEVDGGGAPSARRSE
jgi:hypothetical protein